MEAIANSKSIPKGSYASGRFFLIAAILGGLALGFPIYYTQNPQEIQDSRLNMEKSSGKNGKHANPKARESAEKEYQKVKEELQQWDRKPNKTPEDKDFIKKLRKVLEKLRQKKDFSGENHSQKPKGF